MGQRSLPELQPAEPLGAGPPAPSQEKEKDGEKAVASPLCLAVPGKAGTRGAVTHFPNKRDRQSQTHLRQTHRTGCESQTCT